jgi:hypothetical protein
MSTTDLMARPVRLLLLLCLTLVLAPASAQTIVASLNPDHVAVTVYRAPNRAPSEAFERQLLEGYALISETRTVTLPAGESELRFEGVAGGIVPQSAIVTGFPQGIVERNRDAYLLSPGTLVDRSLGRRVHIRRTSRATGAVRESEAVIRGTAHGVVLQTPEGIEALRCTGLAEGLVFDAVPPGLSARPTLSVRARAVRPVTATIILSYLAEGFDWQADYIAELSEDGAHVDLFAWLTLASNDETSFPNADTQAVAGRLNREEAEVQPREGGPLELTCWPQATTSDIPLEQAQRAPSARDGIDDMEAIVVTGARIRSPNLASTTPVTVVAAELEALGDLKLYRIPEPVTIAANAQKQVALLRQPRVDVRFVYLRQLDASEPSGPVSTARLIRTRNRTADGLGLPLPGGRVALFGHWNGRRILLGEGTLGDRAIGEDVEIDLGEAPGVTTRLTSPTKHGDYLLTVTNDQPAAIRFEAELIVPHGREVRPQGHLSRRYGRPLWTVTVPANGIATLRYRLSGA